MASDPAGITPQLRGAIKFFGGIRKLKKAWEELGTLLTAFTKQPDEATKGKLDDFLQAAGVYLHEATAQLLPHEQYPELSRHPDQYMAGLPLNPVLHILLLQPDAFKKARGWTPYPVLDYETVRNVTFNPDHLLLAHQLAEVALDRLKALEAHVIADEVLEELTPRERQVLSAPRLLDMKDFTRTSGQVGTNRIRRMKLALGR